jgi:hypothetical protein
VANSGLPQLDTAIFEAVNLSGKAIEKRLDCDLLYFYGEIRHGVVNHFRLRIEQLAAHKAKKETLAICLTTPGGEAEVVEKMVDIVRHHYKQVYFIVPMMALSAGTIFAMSGNRIFMDYSSSLGPIDPQVPDKEDKYLVPALGYLDKVAELVEKSRANTNTPAELAILARQDLAMLRFYEQAKDLSVALLKDCLTQYKFANWTEHKTTNPGSPVTKEQKEARAAEIAGQLCDNKLWHSHGRMIGMKKLQGLRLEIDDYGTDPALLKSIRTYADTLFDYMTRQGIDFFLYNHRLV